MQRTPQSTSIRPARLKKTQDKHRDRKVANAAIVVASALLIAGLGVAAVQDQAAEARNAEAIPKYTPPAVTSGPVAERPTLPGEGGKAVFIGDSYTQGTGADDREDGNWAARAANMLGWDATILGIGGTGFVYGGKAGDEQFVHRIEENADSLNPDVVVIQGGQNDHEASPENLREAVTTTLDAAEMAWPQAELIVVGPTAPQPLGGMLGRIATPIDQTATAAGVVSINPVQGRWLTDANTEKYDFDGSHVNDAGHGYLAEKFVEIVRRFQD